jgi:hypothetical protein
VIRVAGENLLGAVKLLQQHAAHQQMRPSHRAERQHRIGAGDKLPIEAVGATDRESEHGATLIAPLAETLGEITARPGKAALVKRGEPCARRQCSEDQLGLARL